jgi:3-hydroxyisobutyrate dehydrogenase-like beta-hydroxyacid dehydrogenase
MNKIGILHPGEMGVSVAASARNSGHLVYWVSKTRSERTRRRAEEQDLIEVQSLTELCLACEIILSICPPHAAEEVAMSVIAEGYKGIYLDANAISPQRVMKLHQVMKENGVRVIDGSIIGGPAWKPGETVLYLSGMEAEIIKECFQSGSLETKIIGEDVGKASALKMCYAAYSKGTIALLLAILATAEALGVRAELYQQWERDDPGFSEQVDRRVVRATAKAWRFAGEMEEIAATFEEAGLPGGFHQAAAEVYRHIADAEPGRLERVDQVLAALLHKTDIS